MRGKELETMVSTQNTIYRAQEEAFVWANPPGARVVNHKDGPKTIFCQRGAPDYFGVMSNGIAVSFDCKQSNTKTRLPLVAGGRRKSFIHQLSNLATITSAGGLGFVLVWMRTIDSAWVVPVRSVLCGWAWEFMRGTRASLSLAELDDIGYRLPNGPGPMPWLEGVYSWIEDQGENNA